MVVINNDTYIPYEFANINNALKHIISRCHGIKQSLRFVEMNKEHLIVRCPLSGDYLEICGEPDEIFWINRQLHLQQWYRKD